MEDTTPADFSEKKKKSLSTPFNPVHFWSLKEMCLEIAKLQTGLKKKKCLKYYWVYVNYVTVQVYKEEFYRQYQQC